MKVMTRSFRLGWRLRYVLEDTLSKRLQNPHRSKAGLQRMHGTLCDAPFVYCDRATPRFGTSIGNRLNPNGSRRPGPIERHWLAPFPR